jgi:thiol-disulfide isomerase/thioredoxin
VKLFGPTLLGISALLCASAAEAQALPQTIPPATTQTPKSQEPKQPGTPQIPAKKPVDAEAELQKALDDAGNDRAALVRNLEEYLKRFPDAPRKAQIYRALVEAATQLRDNTRALDYAERFIAIRPDDTSMMLVAIDLLSHAGDAHSLEKAVGYATRVLDRVEKASAEGKPARVSEADWQATQKRAAMSLYLLRGRLQMERHEYDAATADLNTSYGLAPNPAAALRLGEIAELRKDYKKAIEDYVLAFVLPDQEESSVDRRDLRRKLGNLWQLTNGSTTGLGERILQAYDRLNLEEKPASSTHLNAGLSDPYAFVLRRPSDAAAVKLAEWKGKVLVLNFWATWCGPCHELEPLFDQVRRKYEGHAGIGFFAVNSDEDESRVQPYVTRERLRTTVVFADGLDALLEIRALPTVLVLDGTGKIVYRAQGFDEDGFVEKLTTAIERALTGTS